MDRKILKKRLMALVLAALLFAALQSPAKGAPSGFTDVKDTDWFAPAVSFCLEEGLMDGVGGGRFAPRDTVSRAMAVTVLYRLTGSPSTSGRTGFSDVGLNDWFAPAVAWAARSGIVSGYDAGYFGAADGMTREQLAAILWRYAGSPQAGPGRPYADEGEISAYASTAVDWVNATGIMNGTDDNRFLPRAYAYRAELAAAMKAFSESGLVRTAPSYLNEMDVHCAPADIVLTEGGTMLVTDTFNRVIWQVKNGVATVYAGPAPSEEGERPEAGYSDSSLGQSLFASPWAIAPFLDGWAVSDPLNNVIRLLRLTGVETLNAKTTEDLPTGEMGVIFSYPSGLATDDAGMLYVSDTHSGAIRCISPSGALMTYVIGLEDPMGLAWHDGALYVAETGANRIVRVVDKEVQIVAGSGEAGWFDGPAGEATFTAPMAIAFAENGDLYISDTASGAVRRLRNGRVTTVIAQSDGDPDSVPITPIGLAVQDGILYICDNFSHKVFTVTLKDG